LTRLYTDCRAWIVSPNWLKESFKQGKFVGESRLEIATQPILAISSWSCCCDELDVQTIALDPK
jgi:hypothetical protein